MNDLIIIGAGGFGICTASIVERINAVHPTWNLLGFLDDNKDLQNKEVFGYSVLGPISAAADYPNAYFQCSIGFPKIR